MTGASPAVVLFTALATLAAVYAFVCHIRAERVARVAVTRVRASRPHVWPVAAAGVCIALVIVGTRYSGWSW